MLQAKLTSPKSFREQQVSAEPSQQEKGHQINQALDPQEGLRGQDNRTNLLVYMSSTYCAKTHSTLTEEKLTKGC